ncbi:copper chaperone PCu(A)C [Pseudomonas sp. GD03842]|uniref:copper chaperone PCu(A)C n=1 Tax=unclassified Pseudomonas TaxID=196821 RepID=UPI000D3C0D37|nr:MULTISPECIES: copper chaperone PCu(A)C [unclassified Pseudomonas]MDH0747112.1 copper chaperone PCu(A)C [Pseudomonas sp. GD03842]RAU44569.1 copper chaperone PCu(A)C [Pseudomonas sp. RIT 409]RAU54994.1 copper chaperone PCu(A)C [Pseudomonas sp. RIT 412]
MTGLFSSFVSGRAARRALAVSLLAGVSLSAMAQTRVEDPWVRTTVPGQPSSGAFMRITAQTDSRLLSVASPVASDVQVHEMSMSHDVMRMGPVDSVPLPAGKTVSLDPDGYHVMLMGLKGQIKEGDQVPLILTIESDGGVRETLQVSAPARSMHDAMNMGHDHGDSH